MPNATLHKHRDIRNQWVSEPSTPERLAELMARSLFAVVVYVVALVAVLVQAGATTDWFTGLGLLAPPMWLMKWVVPDSESEQP